MTVFEKIIKGDLPCNKVLENDKFLAFHDISPKAPIHVLAIPKKFAKDFQEIPLKIWQNTLLLFKRLQKS